MNATAVFVPSLHSLSTCIKHTRTLAEEHRSGQLATVVSPHMIGFRREQHSRDKCPAKDAKDILARSVTPRQGQSLVYKKNKLRDTAFLDTVGNGSLPYP